MSDTMSPRNFVRDSSVGGTRWYRRWNAGPGYRAYLTAAGLIGLMILGLCVGQYTDFEIAGVFCAWLGVQGVVVLTGLTGVTTLGQGALYAVGAYSCLLLVAHAHFSYPEAVVAAAVITALVGAVIALPAARIHGPHLAIVTIALTVVVPQFIDAFTSFTGGENGLTTGGPLEAPGSFVSTGTWQYLVTLIPAALAALSVAMIRSSSFGRRLAAIKRSKELAAAIGANAYMDVIVAFALAGLYGGLGGALLAELDGSISPDGFTFTLSASFLLAAIMGGTTAPFGCLLGAFVITLVPELSSTLPQQLPEYLYAGVPLLIIYATHWLRTSDLASRLAMALRERLQDARRNSTGSLEAEPPPDH